MPDDLNYTPTQKEWAVLSQKNFSCHQCGFTSQPTDDVPSGYMEVISIDNQVNVYCAYCATSKRIGRQVFSTQRHGKLLFLDQLSQSNIIDLVRICGAAPDLQWSTERQKSAIYLLETIGHRQASPKDFPWLSSVGSTSDLAGAMKYVTNPSSREHLFSHLRYFPDIHIYRPINRYFCQVNPHYFKH